jgi:hypothetical protein
VVFLLSTLGFGRCGLLDLQGGHLGHRRSHWHGGVLLRARWCRCSLIRRAIKRVDFLHGMCQHSRRAAITDRPRLLTLTVSGGAGSSLLMVLKRFFRAESGCELGVTRDMVLDKLKGDERRFCCSWITCLNATWKKCLDGYVVSLASSGSDIS